MLRLLYDGETSIGAQLYDWLRKNGCLSVGFGGRRFKCIETRHIGPSELTCSSAGGSFNAVGQPWDNHRDTTIERCLLGHWTVQKVEKAKTGPQWLVP
jgi:hypothetical protein